MDGLWAYQTNTRDTINSPIFWRNQKEIKERKSTTFICMRKTFTWKEWQRKPKPVVVYGHSSTECGVGGLKGVMLRVEHFWNK